MEQLYLYIKKFNSVHPLLFQTHRDALLWYLHSFSVKPVVLVNIYAPNWDDNRFIDRIISLIPNLNSQQLIFGGDLNCVINQLSDHSNPKSTTPSKMAKSLSLFMDQIGSVDPWRTLFPQHQYFSFFSSVHHL